MRSLITHFNLWLSRNVFLVIVLAALHLLFFLLAMKYNHIAFSVDSVDYLHQATNLKAHGSWYAGDWDMPHDDTMYSRRPPLYAIFLFLIQFISTNTFFALAIQNIISVFSLILCCFLFWQFTGIRPVKRWLALLPLLFFPTQFIYANMVMADVLFQFFLILALIFFHHSIRDAKAFLGFCICIALAILTKPVLYLFSVAVPVIALLFYTKKIFHLREVLISLLPLAVVISMSAYNYHVTGYFHYSTVNEKYFSEYGAYLAVGERGNAVAQAKIDSVVQVARQQPDLKSYSDMLMRESFKLVKENKARFVWAQLKGMVYFFTDHGRFDLMAFFVNPDYVQERGWKYYYAQNGISGVVDYVKTFNPMMVLYLGLTALFNIFIFYCLIRFLFARNIAIPDRIVFLILIAYIVIFTGVVGCSRYRMAIFPILWMSYIWFLSARGKHATGETHSAETPQATD